jgi:hypothetical protein
MFVFQSFMIFPQRKNYVKGGIIMSTGDLVFSLENVIYPRRNCVEEYY